MLPYRKDVIKHTSSTIAGFQMHIEIETQFVSSGPRLNSLLVLSLDIQFKLWDNVISSTNGIWPPNAFE